MSTMTAPETLVGRRLNSLAFNITCVDTIPEMGPFEVVPGTQWDAPDGFAHGMFPPKTLYPRYEARAVRKLPQMGDVSVRSALTIHRGTKNLSQHSRPVLVLGVDAPDARNAERHDLQMTRRFPTPRGGTSPRASWTSSRPSSRHTRSKGW